MKINGIRHYLTAVNANNDICTIQENDWVKIITFDGTRIVGWISNIGVNTIQIKNSEHEVIILNSDIDEIDFWA